MRLHDYIIKYGEDEGLMLFNPINEAILFLPNVSEIDIMNLSEQDRKILLEKLFLSDNVDSSKFVAGFYEKIRYSQRKISLVIHTNYSCNLNCSYCYQEGSVSRSSTMSEKTIQYFWKFFEKINDNNLTKVIDLCFIGGEPLLCASTIERIYAIASQVCHGKKITTTLVTNGTLLLASRQCLDKIGFDCIQVTLDGPSPIHDKYRRGNNTSEQFGGIIFNLHELQKTGKYNVVININLTRESLISLEDLIKTLKTNGIDYPLIFSIVFSGANNDCSSVAIPISEQANAWYSAHILAKKYGYGFGPLYRLSRFSCGLHKENSLCISPDGIIYKCISGMGLNEYFVSSIEDYGTRKYYNRIAQLLEAPKRCEKAADHSCEYALICDGGCSFKSSINGWRCQYLHLKNADIKFLYRQVVDG